MVSERDIIKAQMALIGNDRLIYGNAFNSNSILDLVSRAIDDLQNYVRAGSESAVNDDAENGYRINIEIFEKGKEKY